MLSAEDVELVARQINKTKTEALLVEALETFENRQKEGEEWEAFHARTFRQEVKDDLRLSRLGSVQADVEALLKGGDLSVDADSAVFKQLCRAALKGLDEFYLNAEMTSVSATDVDSRTSGHLDLCSFLSETRRPGAMKQPVWSLS